jgi:hypothetical protein
LLTLLLLAGLAAVPLPRTLGTIHGDRAGFRRAGEWIASHAEPGAAVVDPFSWAGYYSGRSFEDGQAAASSPPVTYVVLEEGLNEHEHIGWLLGPARDLARRGTVAQKFPVSHGKQKGAVVVYRVPARS